MKPSCPGDSMAPTVETTIRITPNSSRVFLRNQQRLQQMKWPPHPRSVLVTCTSSFLLNVKRSNILDAMLSTPRRGTQRALPGLSAYHGCSPVYGHHQNHFAVTPRIKLPRIRLPFGTRRVESSTGFVLTSAVECRRSLLPIPLACLIPSNQSDP